MLSISDATTGSGYGVYSAHDRPRQHRLCRLFQQHRHQQQHEFRRRWLFSATTTTGNASSGVYGEGDCGNCIGVNGYSTNNIGVLGTGGFAGVYALNTGTSNYAVYGTITGHGNTGYAGYFITPIPAAIATGASMALSKAQVLLSASTAKVTASPVPASTATARAMSA